MDTKSFYLSRRRFLKTSLVTAAATGLPGWFMERERATAAPAPKRPGPNDRPGIALVGCGGQGRGDTTNAQRFGEIVAVCDVDARRTESAANQFTRNGRKPAIYRDFRKVMERAEVHVVVNGTPDHWHTLVNLLAVKTGKDVYSEKPLTLTIDEGKHLVKAVRQNKSVFQVGSQQRSDRNFRLACELVRNGRLGKLQEIVVGLPTGPREGPFERIPVPETLDWDFFVGQAPMMDYVGVRKAAKSGDTENVSYAVTSTISWRATTRSIVISEKRVSDSKGSPTTELVKRDKVNPDIFWLKDDALEASPNLPAPKIIATDITADLESALEQFATIAEDMKP